MNGTWSAVQSAPSHIALRVFPPEPLPEIDGVIVQKVQTSINLPAGGGRALVRHSD